MIIKGKEFEIYIRAAEIQAKVKELSLSVSKDYKDKNPLFVVVLNGAFMFAADLMKEVNIPSEISFIKLSSYRNTTSTGKVKEPLGLSEDIFDRHLVFIEDIVDTGLTVSYILKKCKPLKPASVAFISLLYKPKSMIDAFPIRYVGFEIPPDFVVGYGLDYAGYGRNLKDIYRLKP